MRPPSIQRVEIDLFDPPGEAQPRGGQFHRRACDGPDRGNAAEIDCRLGHRRGRRRLGGRLVASRERKDAKNGDQQHCREPDDGKPLFRIHLYNSPSAARFARSSLRSNAGTLLYIIA